MGRKNKDYSKTLHQQAYDRLTEMQNFGTSKKDAIAEGTDKEKIFSFSTYQSYWKHIKYFIQYIMMNHPECTTIDSARKYVCEWLQSRVDLGLSAWTVQLEAKALGKLYGITPEDEDYFTPPKRHREDIKRSRGPCVRDLHFSAVNNEELIKFCRGTGLRRRELSALKGKDLLTREQIEAEILRIENETKKGEESVAQKAYLEMLLDTRLFSEEYFVHVRNGKGGRERVSPIIGENIERIVDKIAGTPADEKVWKRVSGNADIHSYRADYATAMYGTHARAISDIPYDKVHKGNGRRYQSEVYTCRKDEARKKLDKAAMLVCSKALGHNRISVVADYYLRDPEVKKS